MVETTGEMWALYKEPNYVLCITTNGTVKSNGECVMGSGCALEAKTRFPGIARALGTSIKARGNVVCGYLGEFISDINAYKLLFFPVKYNWDESANLNLIRRSALKLKEFAEGWPEKTFILPRPGCGNGGLRWEDVKPLLLDLPDNVQVISREGP
jgi:hypothetical protein